MNLTERDQRILSYVQSRAVAGDTTPQPCMIAEACRTTEPVVQETLRRMRKSGLFEVERWYGTQIKSYVFGKHRTSPRDLERRSINAYGGSEIAFMDPATRERAIAKLYKEQRYQDVRLKG